MQKECFKKLNLWAQQLEDIYNENLKRAIKYDIHYSLALVSLDRLDEIELGEWIRSSDEVVRLDESHWVVFYQYTTIDEAHFAIKNLHSRLKKNSFNAMIVCTDMKASDTSVYKILQRLCFLSSYISEQDEEFLAKSRLEKGMDIFDIDFSDL